MKKQKAISQALIVAAIIIVMNMILNQVYFRIDFTADNKYTLSDATKNLLKNMDEVVTITAYWSENMPPQLQNHRRDFLDMLIEYENRSGGDIVYKVENPNENEQKMAEVQQKGIQPVPVEVTEKDQMKQMLAFMGAILQQGDKTEVISFISPNSNVEFTLTQALKKLIVEDKPDIAIIQGHGEPGLEQMPQLEQSLSALYDVKTYTITDTAEIPASFKSVAIFNPTDTIPQSHFEKLDNYMKSGGGILVGYNQLNPDFNSGFLNAAADIGMRKWLAEKGVQLENQYVIDVNCAAVGLLQQMGPIQVQRRVQMPLIPIIKNFSEHPAAAGLEAVVMQFVSPIEVGEEDSVFSYAVLGSTSERSGTMQVSEMFDLQHDWQENDFRQSNIPVAVALQGKGEWADARMVIVANGGFAVNGAGQEAQQLSPDNINFASNSIDWLADDTGLIELRTKSITARFLDPVEDDTRLIIKWTNVLAPVILVLVIGFIRRQQYLRKKQKWLQGEY